MLSLSGSFFSGASSHDDVFMEHDAVGDGVAVVAVAVEVHCASPSWQQATGATSSSLSCWFGSAESGRAPNNKGGSTIGLDEEANRRITGPV